jgi:hypothetical protein
LREVARFYAVHHPSGGGGNVTVADAVADFSRLPVPIPQWPKNAMRHTFCTMLMSLHGDAAKVANWSRHTSPRELYQSYVARLVSKAEARRFLWILPAA